MGLWLGPTLGGPIPSLIFVFVVGIIIDPVRAACHIDNCWTLFDSAQQAIESGQMDSVYGESETRCVPVRTYHHCLKNMSRSCYGDIKFHSALKVVQSRLEAINCTKQGPTYSLAAAHNVNVIDEAAKREQCTYKGNGKFRHCGLFGDPHLRTFSGHHQTCRVKGAWTLIDNEHLLVQVTNQPVGKYGSATAISKLTIIIRQNECASPHFLTYQAYTDYLPTVFDNGLSAYGPDDAVRLVTERPGQRVSIHVRHIATTIIVNQVGRYFTFAVKMPDEIVRNNKRSPYRRQLCVSGCPKRERIKFKHYLTERKDQFKTGRVAMAKDVADRLCRESRVMDFYLDSCIFDLMMTGDTNFTLAAHAAWRDMLGLVPDAESESEYQTLSNGAERSSTTTTSLFYAFLIATLSCTNLFIQR